MQPIKSLSASYYQLGSLDSQVNNAVYVRITNIAPGNAYDLKIRTAANNDSTTIGWIVVAPGESLIVKKEPDQWVYGSSSNLYAQPVSPRE
jgi:hypothetical protein